MNNSVKKEIEELIKELPSLKCSTIEEFEEIKSITNWCHISQYQMSENFIKEFKDEICWLCISYSQSQFSESFIYEFKNKLHIPELISRGLITRKRLKEIEFEKEYNSRTKCSRFELMDI